jgi:hypothetical protein
MNISSYSHVWSKSYETKKTSFDDCVRFGVGRIDDAGD